MLITMFVMLAHISCEKIIETEAPYTSINADNVYSNDETAIAVVTGIFVRMSNNSFVSADISMPNVDFLLSLSSDELNLHNSASNTSVIEFYKNELSAISANALSFWNTIYPIIFDCNNAIEGISKSASLTPAVQQQLLGESKFCRAFCYFYLVNLYGDVPLIVSTDWQTNSAVARTDKNEVWNQIIMDLNESKQALNEGYIQSDAMTIYPVNSAERIRPNRAAATALLARALLYTGDYVNAEIAATEVINNTEYYNLTDLNSVFIMNSNEAIWQWQNTVSTFQNTPDAQVFILPNSGPNNSNPFYISNSLLESFEAEDQRKLNWLSNVVIGTDTFYFPFKYKVNDQDAEAAEYTMVLRLSEQYMIRAEARAQLNNIQDALDDLNTIRTRAGLSASGANDKSSLLTAIFQERMVELFTEMGHRWLDLKRTRSINSVMDVITPIKGGIWQPTDEFYPLPLSELEKAPQLVQNQGY